VAENRILATSTFYALATILTLGILQAIGTAVHETRSVLAYRRQGRDCIDGQIWNLNPLEVQFTFTKCQRLGSALSLLPNS
jgi:hypothetical protein